MGALRKFDALLNRFCQYFSGAMLGVVAVVCAVQVFCRYVLNDSLSWSEELMRYLFIWMVLFATTITVKHGSGATVDILCPLLRKISAKGHTILVNLSLGIGGAIFVLYGCRIVSSTMTSLTAALRIPMGVVYLCVPISGAIIVIHCLTGILDALFPEKKEGEDV